jgi:hypothetical protein
LTQFSRRQAHEKLGSLFRDMLGGTNEVRSRSGA